ncbi:MAG: nucleotide exchange factor GrpE [Acidimicrobiales bacterium]
MSEKRRLANEPTESNVDGEAQEDPGEPVADEAAGLVANESAERANKNAPADAVAAQRDEYLEMLQRLQAEFENYRKRTIRQQTDLLQRASEGLIERLLPVLDALDLAVAHAENDEANGEHLKGALAQIDALARKVLAQEGLERIDEANVAFDPEIHDAVAHVPAHTDESGEDEATERDHGRVSEVLRTGYRLHGRVLRPAMVKVEG